MPSTAITSAGSDDAVFANAGITLRKIRPLSAGNCFAEQLVLTIRTELADRTLILGAEAVDTAGRGSFMTGSR
jgi:hypothetical protein